MSYFDYTANTPACEEALQRFCEVERGMQQKHFSPR